MLKKVHVKNRNHDAVLVHRDRMRSNRAKFSRFTKSAAVPATTLPVDGTNHMGVLVPMDGNDTLGDCGEAMSCHGDNILTYGQGKPGWTESTFNLNALEQQYLKVSGGDNGLTESDVVHSIWGVGIAGVAAAKIVDAVDFDVTNVALTQFILDNFYLACMAWSVPDDFLNGFDTGTVWQSADTPDPANGHFTPITDVMGPHDVVGQTNLNGFYRIITWGTWCYASPAFIASVQPECFTVLSPRQFNAQGFDSKGRHVSAQAALWVSVLGGNPTIAAKLVAMFPAAPPAPTPTPTPMPTPTPTPTPTPAPTPTPVGRTIVGYTDPVKVAFTIGGGTRHITIPAQTVYNTPASANAAVVTTPVQHAQQGPK